MDSTVLFSSATSSLQSFESEHKVENVDEVEEVEEVDQMDEMEEVEQVEEVEQIEQLEQEAQVEEVEQEAQVEQVDQKNLLSSSLAADISDQVPLEVLSHIFILTLQSSEFPLLFPVSLCRKHALSVLLDFQMQLRIQWALANREAGGSP